MIIVGLGNIGSIYEGTRHNVGFIVVDNLASKLGVKFKKKECKSEVAEYNYLGEKVIIAKPQTFMNLSGEAVFSLIKKYNADFNDVYIVYDDIDLPFGDTRYREGGSGGTHNGMKNIVEVVKTTDIKRLRVGIGRPENSFVPLADFVLSKFSKSDLDTLSEAVDKATEFLIDKIKSAK